MNDAQGCASALHRTGFANIATSRRADDGLHLTDAYILSAVRLGCYHPSRQNTNTGTLTAPMMESVFSQARRLIDTT